MLEHRIAVVDLETTGLSPGKHDRVIEIGVVLIALNGAVLGEYETLVNPRRDIGPTSIHGITSAELVHAPSFEEIAGDLLALLQGATVLAGHNVGFDRNFLVKEFERIGLIFPDAPLLCTYRRLGRNLRACCEEYGIATTASLHRALVDARVTAQLVAMLCADDPEVLRPGSVRPVNWPTLLARGTPCVRREDAQASSATPPAYLQRLASRIRHDLDAEEPELLAYLALLDRVLEDRVIDDAEGEAIIEAAEQWGLTLPQIGTANRQYLQNLAFHALADGVVTDAERRDLHLVARLLGQGEASLGSMLDAAAGQLACIGRIEKPAPREKPASGQSVCFTGELQGTVGGQPITRAMAEVLAEQAGFSIANGLTKIEHFGRGRSAHAIDEGAEGSQLQRACPCGAGVLANGGNPSGLTRSYAGRRAGCRARARHHEKRDPAADRAPRIALFRDFS